MPPTKSPKKPAPSAAKPDAAAEAAEAVDTAQEDVKAARATATNVHAVLKFDCDDCEETQRFIVTLGDNTAVTTEQYEKLVALFKEIHEQNCDLGED